MLGDGLLKQGLLEIDRRGSCGHIHEPGMRVTFGSKHPHRDKTSSIPTHAWNQDRSDEMSASHSHRIQPFFRILFTIPANPMAHPVLDHFVPHPLLMEVD